jgi:hypothetical protein
LYTLLEGLESPSPKTPLSTAELSKFLGADFVKRLNAMNESANAVRLLSGTDVRDSLRLVEECLTQCAVIRAYKPNVSELPSFAEVESGLITAMSAEVLPT